MGGTQRCGDDFFHLARAWSARFLRDQKQKPAGKDDEGRGAMPRPSPVERVNT
jgi:hypothetical protein